MIVLEKYIDQIDHTGSADDEYAKFIHYCLVTFGKPFERLLEQAEEENKKLKLIDEFVDEITIDNIELV